MKPSLPGRPTHDEPCTCIRQRNPGEIFDPTAISDDSGLINASNHDGHRRIQSSLPDVAYAIPGAYSSGSQDELLQKDVAKPLVSNALQYRSVDTTRDMVGGVVSSQKQIREPATRSTTKWSTGKSQLADRPIPDLLVRRIKKNVRKSMEHKLRELVSYKAELLNMTRTLVPKQIQTAGNAGLPDIIESFSYSNRSQTFLCHSCLTQLKTYLFFSPVPRSTYLYEHAVPAFLSLLDDAIVARQSASDMEAVSHHELSSILQAELSVVEWRLSLKLARFHKKTGYLAVFPMEIGPYADLEIKRGLNKPMDGVLTVLWKKMKSFYTV